MSASLVAHQVQVRQLYDRVDLRLQDAVTELAWLSRQAQDPVSGEPITTVTALLDRYLVSHFTQTGEAVLVYHEGSLHDSSLARYPLDALPPEQDRPWNADVRAAQPTTSAGVFATPSGQARYAAHPVRVGSDAGMVVTVLLPARELSDYRRQLWVMLAGSVLLACAAGCVSWLLTRRLLRPVLEVTSAARTVARGSLTPRVLEPGHGETADMARAVNSMLDRIETMLASQKRFVRRTSHELRDPLTVCQGHLELLRDGISDEKAALPIVFDELARMGRIVDDLQVLADAGHRDFIIPAEVEVEELTHELLVKAAALARRQWTLDGAATGTVRADRHRLTEAVLNLVHNAVMHTQESDVIAIGSSVNGNRWRLWVRDTGIGADPQQDLFRPSVRGAGSRNRYQGSGLGLAIVGLIAEGHGGSAEILTAPLEGFTATLDLPVVAGGDGPSPLGEASP
ncbi:MAG: HAMP domain-containing sensor histidine kinase [Dermatophilaceae bacterium]